MSAGEETTAGALVKQNTAFHTLKMSVVHSDPSSSSLARLLFNVKKENEEQIQLMFTRHRMSAEHGTDPFSTGAASDSSHPQARQSLTRAQSPVPSTRGPGASCHSEVLGFLKEQGDTESAMLSPSPLEESGVRLPPSNTSVTSGVQAITHSY